MKKNIIKKVIYSGMALIIVAGSVIISFKKVTLDIDGNKKVVYTIAKNYEELLKKENVEIKENDEISVGLNDKIIRNSEVEINLNKYVSILVDGQTINTQTLQRNVNELLQQLGITLGENDKINKDINDKLVDNDTIKITRVEIKNEIETSETAFNTTEVKDYKTPVGETRVISDGEYGELSKYYEVTYEDGNLVNKEFIKEEVSKEPVNQVIGVGIFDPESLTVCVNGERMVSADYEPPDLVLPKIRSSVSTEKLYMRREAANALENLFDDAEREGIYLYGVSGYRSYSYQQSIYNPYSGYSARPGASEHQLGLAMDLSTSYLGGNLVTDFGYTDEGKWVEENAHKYGFVVRYMEGKESITGYYYEPWHIRYVGVELATELKDKGITLEEYYGIY